MTCAWAQLVKVVSDISGTLFERGSMTELPVPGPVHPWAGYCC